MLLLYPAEYEEPDVAAVEEEVEEELGAPELVADCAEETHGRGMYVYFSVNVWCSPCGQRVVVYALPKTIESIRMRCWCTMERKVTGG